MNYQRLRTAREPTASPAIARWWRRMQRRAVPLSIAFTAVLLVSAGCGLTVRSPLSTGSGATVPKSAKVRTANEASQIAINASKTTLNSREPQVQQVRLMVADSQGPPTGRYRAATSSDDPARLLWVVDLDQDGQATTPCPAPPPGIDQTICWYPETATIAISVMTGNVEAIGAPYPRDRGTPYAATIGVPPSATLPTREAAMQAGFKLVPGQDGKPATILEVRLLSVAEWSTWLTQHGSYIDVREVDPSTPIWEMEFVNAALAQGCSGSNASACVHDHLYLFLNAMTGQSLGFLFPAAGSPANYTP